MPELAWGAMGSFRACSGASSRAVPPLAPSPTPPPPHWLRPALIACAILLFISAANHARLAALGEASVQRHQVFVGINAGLALLLLARPRWALLPTIALTVQQMNGHGRDLLASIKAPSLPFDWASLGVVLFFPALIALLVVARRGAVSPA